MTSTSRFRRAERLRDVMRAERAEHLLARALAAGLVTDAQIAAARASDDPGAPAADAADVRSLLDRLVARGALAPAALAVLEETEANEALARSAFGRRAPIPPEAEAAAADPERRLGDLILVAPLSEGGTGQVWKGWDPNLGRPVAVKIATAALESTFAHERFAREVLATAQLEHPSVVQVYRAGIDRGRSYLVMQLVDGQTLTAACAGARMPVRRALEIAEVVASCLDHAHRRGIVHRDVKPGNIMITHEGGHVFLVDFGLTYLKEEGASSITRPGEVLGTAAFMSPEQARGDESARLPATDIYGLGATLYYMVTGEPPFRAVSFSATIAQVIECEPASPRRLRPELEAALETVILKAMDKDPRRRYATAGAMAEDLGRLINDQPITASRSRLAAGLRAWLQSRRVVKPALVALALVALVAGGWNVRERRRRMAAVESFREISRLSLDTALRLRRAGDLSGLKHVLPLIMGAYQRARGGAPDLPDVEYSLGRLCRALMDTARALDHDERALTIDGAFAPALYERAILLSERYGKNRRAAETLRDEPGATRAAHAADLSRTLADLEKSVVADLSRLRAVELDQAASLAATGILAYHQLRHEEAIAALERSVTLDPHREEAWSALAYAAWDAGNLAKAELAFSEGIGRDKGYLPHLAGRCQLRLVRGDVAGAEADADAALAMEPGFMDAWDCAHAARLHRAYHEMDHGIDPLPNLARDEAAHTDRMGVEPGNLWLFHARGSVRRLRAVDAMAHGLDPMTDLRGAIDDLTRALDVAAPDAGILGQRGRARGMLARALAARGADPLADFRAAEQDVDAAIGLAPRHDLFWRWRAGICTERGAYRLERGEDPAADLGCAREALARAFESANPPALLHVMRGRLGTFEGVAAARKGRDPLPLWKAAEEDLGRGIDGAPDTYDPWLERGILRSRRGARDVRKKPAVAAVDLAAAAQDLDRALAIDARLQVALTERAQVALLRRRR